MEYFKELSEKDIPIDILNYNYRQVYDGSMCENRLLDFLKENDCGADGILEYRIVLDDDKPLAGYVYNQSDDKEDEDLKIDLSYQENSLWRGWRVGTLTIPSSGRLFLILNFKYVTIFGDFDARHCCMLCFDATNKLVRFFDPNGPEYRRYELEVKILEQYTRKLVPDWKFISIGKECAPHDWYSCGYGICALWVLVYAMMSVKMPHFEPSDIGDFIRSFERKALSKLLSHIMMMCWKEGYYRHKKYMNLQIPSKYKDLILSNTFSV